ncbi:hypothetical protein BJV74DRAFT_869491 [Russula compacta]|nr:hypothetical protein BJV74DRAFT_869491 [Russula compacta]
MPMRGCGASCKPSEMPAPLLYLQIRALAPSRDHTRVRTRQTDTIYPPPSMQKNLSHRRVPPPRTRGHGRGFSTRCNIREDRDRVGRSCSPCSSTPVMNKRCQPPPELLLRATEYAAVVRARVHARAVDETHKDLESSCAMVRRMGGGGFKEESSGDRTAGRYGMGTQRVRRLDGAASCSRFVQMVGKTEAESMRTQS